jgi:hypothetical protein
MATVQAKFSLNGEAHAMPLEFARVPAVGEFVSFADRLWIVGRLVHKPVRRDRDGNAVRAGESEMFGDSGGRIINAVIWLSEAGA